MRAAVHGHAAAVLLLVAALLLGACDKPGWLADFEARMDAAVPRLVDALNDLAASMPGAVDRLDEITARRVAEFERVLAEHLEGLQTVLADNRERFDAALVARTEQLAAAAEALALQLGEIARGVRTEITVSVDDLLIDTELASRQLLVSLDLAIASVENEGDLVVAHVYSVVSAVIVQIAGAGIVLVALVLGGVLFLWRRSERLGIGGVLAVVVLALMLVAGGVLMVANVVRNWFMLDDVVIATAGCPATLARGIAYLGRYEDRAPVPAAAIGEATDLMPALLACRVRTSNRDLYDRIGQVTQRIRKQLGIDEGCSSHHDCRGGQRCDARVARCTSDCSLDVHCAEGLVCHEDFALCAKVCTDPSAPPCPSGGICGERGRCHPTTSSAGTPLVEVLPLPGGIGWTQLHQVCGSNVACILASPIGQRLYGHIDVRP